jgi:hypothetical protein
VAGAAAQAKKWGWNALQRNGEQRIDGVVEGPGRPKVMGRGQPLPPPGVPLPSPGKKTKTAPIPVPKRKPIPSPEIPSKHKDDTPLNSQHHALPPPPLPKRRSIAEADIKDDGLLVVSAPMVDSEPTTPINESPPSYMPPWVEDTEELGDEPKIEPKVEPQVETKSESLVDSQVKTPVLSPGPPPLLPKRRTPHRILSSSPEEDGHKLPSWMAAQEEEARAKSTFIDEDGGVYER